MDYEKLPPEKQAEVRNRRFRELLSHAREHSPYYRELYRELPDALADMRDTYGSEAVNDEFWSLFSRSKIQVEASGYETVWPMDRAREVYVTAIRNLKRAEIGRPALTV
jgi:hypothetical protein